MIPPKAALVFKGVIFDTYQWEQELFDGSTATFEKLKRPDSANILAIKDGKILITKERQPGKDEYIGLLGGRVDEGENPLDGAKRELLEESGLGSEKWELFKTYAPYNKMQWNAYLYIAKDCEHIGEHNHDAGEDITVLELTFDEFVEEVCKETFQNTLLGNEILRMRVNGTLGDFKKRLLD